MNAPDIDPKVAGAVSGLVEQIRRGVHRTLDRLSPHVNDGGIDIDDLAGLFSALDACGAINIEIGEPQYEDERDDEPAEAETEATS